MHELTAHGFATKRPSVGRFYVLALALVGHSAGAEPVDEKAGIRLVCTRGPGAAMAHARADQAVSYTHLTLPTNREV